MEYCEAGSLANIMYKTGSPLNEEEIAIVLSHTLKALNYLHQNKKIHRDIKADNV